MLLILHLVALAEIGSLVNTRSSERCPFGAELGWADPRHRQRVVWAAGWSLLPRADRQLSTQLRTFTLLVWAHLAFAYLDHLSCGPRLT